MLGTVRKIGGRTYIEIPLTMTRLFNLNDNDKMTCKIVEKHGAIIITFSTPYHYLEKLFLGQNKETSFKWPKTKKSKTKKSKTKKSVKP